MTENNEETQSITPAERERLEATIRQMQYQQLDHQRAIAYWRSAYLSLVDDLKQLLERAR